jgi:hypothetical protein
MAETTRPDPYAVLGVPRDALEDEIRAAYRRLVRREHPDKGGSHERFIMVTWAYQMLRVPERRATFDAAGATSDGTDPNWDAYEAEQDLGPSHPVPSHAVLDFGTVSAGELPRSLSFNVFYEADPPEVDYQPRVGRWWTTDALAVDNPNVAIQIEVIVAAPADSPSGDLCDRIVVTFDDVNSTEIEIRGKVVGKPATAAQPSPPSVAPGASYRAAGGMAKPAASTRRRPSARHSREMTFGHRIAMSVIWSIFGLSSVALAFALTLRYAIPPSELPNILWLQFIAIPVCALFLGVVVFALLPWSIVHAVRQWRPKSERVSAPY